MAPPARPHRNNSFVLCALLSLWLLLFPLLEAPRPPSARASRSHGRRPRSGSGTPRASTGHQRPDLVVGAGDHPRSAWGGEEEVDPRHQRDPGGQFRRCRRPGPQAAQDLLLRRPDQQPDVGERLTVATRLQSTSRLREETPPQGPTGAAPKRAVEQAEQYPSGQAG